MTKLTDQSPRHQCVPSVWEERERGEGKEKEGPSSQCDLSQLMDSMPVNCKSLNKNAESEELKRSYLKALNRNSKNADDKNKYSPKKGKLCSIPTKRPKIEGNLKTC